MVGSHEGDAAPSFWNKARMSMKTKERRWKISSSVQVGRFANRPYAYAGSGEMMEETAGAALTEFSEQSENVYENKGTYV